MAGLRKLADQIAEHGRYGDSELVHMNPEEIAVLEQLLGQKLTVNPDTGQLEAFSWKKLLAGLGAAAGVAMMVVPGLQPFGMPLLAKTAPLLASTLAGVGSGAASNLISGAFKDEKKGDPKLSEAAEYLKKKNEADAKNNAGVPIIAANLNQNVGGYDPLGREKNYFSYGAPVQPEPMSGGIRSLMAQGYAGGGQLEPEELKGQQIIEMAMRALQGQSEDPHADLNQFVATYGPEALQSLAYGGKVEGPGGGMDDMVTADLNGQKVLLSPDEFVVPADVVSGLGDGSSEAGARKLHAMMARVRAERTGKTTQPKKINDQKVMPR